MKGYGSRSKVGCYGSAASRKTKIQGSARRRGTGDGRDDQMRVGWDYRGTTEDGTLPWTLVFLEAAKAAELMTAWKFR